jgi:hypothetical protein
MFLTSLQSPPPVKVGAKERFAQQSNKGNSGGSDSAAALALHAAIERTQVLQDIENVEKRSFRLIDCTSNGIMFSTILRRILSREVRMIAWKNEKCKSYGRKRSIESSNETDNYSAGCSNSNDNKNKKEKKIPFSWEVSADNISDPAIKHPRLIQKNKVSYSSTVFNDDTFEEAEYSFDCSTQNVIEYAQNLVDRVPDFDQHISHYIDAEEGTNIDIDPDFQMPHPKDNPFYVWRALRLLSQSNVSAFESMADGKLVNGLVHLGLLKVKPTPLEVPITDTAADTADATADATAATNATEDAAVAVAAAAGRGGDIGDYDGDGNADDDDGNNDGDNDGDGDNEEGGGDMDVANTSDHENYKIPNDDDDDENNANNSDDDADADNDMNDDAGHDQDRDRDREQNDEEQQRMDG